MGPRPRSALPLVLLEADVPSPPDRRPMSKPSPNPVESKRADPYRPPGDDGRSNSEPLTSSGPGQLTTGAMVIIGLVIVLLIAHQDNWFWTDDTAVFGFLPIGLAYHAGLSIAASFVWFLATRIAWPLDDVDDDLLGEPAHHPPNESVTTTGDA